LAGTRTRSLSPLLQAVAVDNSLPISPIAAALWLRDVENPLRWGLRPLLQLVFAAVLHIVWYLKRLPLPQFRAHALLQRTICWFCRVFVSPEANQLILRHFASESNILNFLRDNTASTVHPIELYPRAVDDMMQHSFVKHDQELFRMMREMGPWDRSGWPVPETELKWEHWREIDATLGAAPKRWTQVVDFETAHALFMCLFCLLLTAEEYRDSINGFNLDQSVADLGHARRSDDRRDGLQQASHVPGWPLEPRSALPHAWVLHGVSVCAPRADPPIARWRIVR
jgi:hypothetical protein